MLPPASMTGNSGTFKRKPASSAIRADATQPMARTSIRTHTAAIMFPNQVRGLPRAPTRQPNDAPGLAISTNTARTRCRDVALGVPFTRS